MFKQNKHIAILLIGLSVLVSFLLWQYAESLAAGVQLFSVTRFEEWTGLIAIWLLYFAVLPGPLYRVFPAVPYKNQYRRILGGLGWSAFYFALLHSLVAFYGLLDGFSGLPFLGGEFLFALAAGLGVLLILAMMSVTSTEWAMKVLGSTWKKLHRLVYFALVLLAAHLLLIGAHFRNFLEPTALSFVLAFIFLLILYAISTRNLLVQKYPGISSRTWTGIVYFVTFAIIYGTSIMHEIIIGGHVH